MLIGDAIGFRSGAPASHQVMLCGFDVLERLDGNGRRGLMVGGCGLPIAGRADLYRCVDCCSPFHRDCLRRHCADTDCKDALIERLSRRLGKVVRILGAKK